MFADIFSEILWIIWQELRRNIVISNMAEQLRLAVSLWTCILEVGGSKLGSISLQAVLNVIVFMVLAFPEENGMVTRKWVTTASSWAPPERDLVTHVLRPWIV
jgi:hypothetical protein